MPGQSGHSGRSSDAKKTLRAQCWKNGQQRKLARTEAQHQSEITNRALRKVGSPTPWETACAERALRRAGMREIWLASRKGEQLPAA